MSLGTVLLPRFSVLKIFENAYVYNNEKEASVVGGEDSAFSPLVKIEAERAQINQNYVHLRFGYNNKYWQKKSSGNDDAIVAVSTKPEEDTAKASCTLFEPTMVSSNQVYLTHVPTRRRVMVNNATSALYVDKAGSSGAVLGFVDWSALVKLPPHVTFKGDNDKYLQSIPYEGYNYLKYQSNDPNDPGCGYKVSLMRDGHVRIKNDYWDKFWRYATNWIRADSDDVTANKDTLFWPIKINADTIALRCAANNKFLKRLTTEGKESCLNAGSDNITIESRIQVQELVDARSISNVRYRMEDARIYAETPYIAGTASVINNGDDVANLSVAIAYVDEKTYSFSNSVAITTGVKTSIKTGVPFIAEGKVEISFQVETTFEWTQSRTTTTSVTATGSVPVPAKSVASVNYVGTQGTCDVPFSYTQQDRSSTDGKITETNQIDGVYNGVNCYNFNFVIAKVQALH